jgi:hypothetical protein
MDFVAEYQKLLSMVTQEPRRGFDLIQSPLRGLIIPGPLQFVYKTAGRMKLNQVHNQLYNPAGLTVDPDGFVTFGVENQGAVVWGYRAENGNGNPLVYQRILGNESYGTWTEEKNCMSRFLISFGYWSAAMGAADASGVGEIGESDREKFEALPVVWEDPDFTVRGHQHCLTILLGGGDFYAFGKDANQVYDFIDSLGIEIFDMGNMGE